MRLRTLTLVYISLWLMPAIGPVLAGETAPESEPTKRVYVEFDPPAVVPVSPELVDRLRESLDEEPVAAAYMSLRSLADAALDRTPNPIGVLIYEGRVSNDPQRIQTVKHLYDMLDLRALAWVYAMEKEPQHLAAASELLEAWITATKPTGNDVNDNKLATVVQAYLILHTDLDSDLLKKTREWIRQLQSVHLERIDQGVGNRYVKRLKLIAMASTALDDQDMLLHIQDRMKIYIEQSLRPDGTSFDLEERDAMHYHVSGLNASLQLALWLPDGIYAWRSPTGSAIQLSVDYVRPYALGDKTHAEWVHSRVTLDRKRFESGDPYYRPGKPWDPAHSLEMFTLALVHDPSLAPVVNHVSTLEVEPLPWQQAALQALSKLRLFHKIGAQ